MNIAIISCSKDKASSNIKAHLIGNFDFNKLKDQFDGNNVYRYGIDDKITKLYTIESEHIYTDDLDKKIDADLFIFISKHSAKEGRPSLTCHPIGNFGNADFGGKEKTLCPVNSILLKNIFIELNRNADSNDYEVTMEATHHGPYMEKPVLFVEIGSSEKEWEDKNAGNIIAKSVINAIEKHNDSINNEHGSNNNKKNNDNPNTITKNSMNNKNNFNNKNLMGKIDNEKNDNLIDKNNNYECVFVIGGSHYNHVAAKAMLKTNLSVGHICAKYSLGNLNLELIKDAMEKTVPKSKFVLLEWKGLGKEKQQILGLLNHGNIAYERSDKFF